MILTIIFIQIRLLEASRMIYSLEGSSTTRSRRISNLRSVSDSIAIIVLKTVMILGLSSLKPKNGSVLSARYFLFCILGYLFLH